MNAVGIKRNFKLHTSRGSHCFYFAGHKAQGWKVVATVVSENVDLSLTMSACLMATPRKAELESGRISSLCGRQFVSCKVEKLENASHLASKYVRSAGKAPGTKNHQPSHGPEGRTGCRRKNRLGQRADGKDHC